jgi:hypothetical protein
MAAGCYPVVPDRLAYPEFIDAEYRYADGGIQSNGQAYQREIQSAVQLILQLAEKPPSAVIDLSGFSWAQLGGKYQQLIEEVGRC